jgi:hypothetical protein
MLGVPGIAARTFEALHREGISVSLISQSSSEQSICFAVPERRGQARAPRLLEEFHDEIGRKDIDGIESRTAWRRSRWWGWAWRAIAASRRACSRRWRTRASTSSPSRKDRRS